MSDTKQCPYCAETIQAAAKKCRFCGEWLEGEEASGHEQPVRSGLDGIVTEDPADAPDDSPDEEWVEYAKRYRGKNAIGRRKAWDELDEQQREALLAAWQSLGLKRETAIPGQAAGDKSFGKVRALWAIWALIAVGMLLGSSDSTDVMISAGVAALPLAIAGLWGTIKGGVPSLWLTSRKAAAVLLAASAFLLAITPWDAMEERNREAREQQRQAEAAAERREADAERRKEANCRNDLQCWGDRHSIAAAVRCDERVEARAQYSARWTDGMLEPKFSHFRWSDKSQGHVTYIGDKIEFQNGFGAWSNMIYECDFDPDAETVIAVRVEQGRLSQ